MTTDRDTELDALRAQNEELRAALQFYAAEGHWLNDTAECHGAPVIVPWTAPVYGDNGQTARAALAERLPVERERPTTPSAPTVPAVVLPSGNKIARPEPGLEAYTFDNGKPLLITSAGEIKEWIQPPDTIDGATPSAAADLAARDAV